MKKFVPQIFLTFVIALAAAWAYDQIKQANQKA